MKTSLRTSTIRRISKLRELIAELERRALDVTNAALTLQVSTSTARKYLQELCDAEVAIERAMSMGGASLRYEYSLTADTGLAWDFSGRLALATLTHKLPPRSAGKSVAAPAGRSVHVLADDVDYAISMARVVPQRDPLVAALFGPPQPDL